MISMLGSEPDAGSVCEPQPTPFRLLLGHFETFPPPNTFDAFVVHEPAIAAKKRRDSPIPVPTELAGEIDDLGDEFSLEVGCPRSTTLSGTGLAKDLACPSF